MAYDTVLFTLTRTALWYGNIVYFHWNSTMKGYTIIYFLSVPLVPVGSPSRGGDVKVYVWYEPTELAHSFLFCSWACVCLFGPFNCIPFHKFSQQLSAFSLCSFGLISALLVLSAIVPAGSPSRGGDVTVCVWHKPTELAHSFLFCSCGCFLSLLPFQLNLIQ